MTCDGYPSDSPSFAPVRRRESQNGIVSVELYVPPIWSLPQTGRFTSAHESQFFTLYVEETAPQISGPFQTSLWARLIPQVCEAEPFLRQLVVATAALSYVCTEEFSEHGDLWAANRRSTYSYALKQYGKALRSMRKANNNGNYDLRNALLACLLVYCFESLHGDAKSTAKHAASGLALLSEFISQHTISKAVAVPRTGRFEGLDVEILHAFASLDVQVPAGMGGAHARFMEQFTDTVRTQIPGKIETLEDAKAYWFLVQRRNYHFGIVAKDEVGNSYSDDSWRTQERDHGHQTNEEWNVESLHTPSIAQTHERSKLALKAEMESCREE
jgi:hypothetical protein